MWLPHIIITAIPPENSHRVCVADMLKLKSISTILEYHTSLRDQANEHWFFYQLNFLATPTYAYNIIKAATPISLQETVYFTEREKRPQGEFIAFKKYVTC